MYAGTLIKYKNRYTSLITRRLRNILLTLHIKSSLEILQNEKLRHEANEIETENRNFRSNISTESPIHHVDLAFNYQSFIQHNSMFDTPIDRFD